MISKEKFRQIEEKFRHEGSWAIWSPKTEATKAKSGVDNMKIFTDDPNVHKKLNPEYIIVGIDKSKDKDKDKDKNGVSWKNFHTGSTKLDYMLRYAFVGEDANKETEFTGAYMTDAIKEHPCEETEEVPDYVNNHPELLKKNMEILQKEIDMLGGKPTLIALGGEVKKWLDKNFDNYDIYKITHMAARGQTKEKLRTEVEELEEKIKSN